MDRLTADGLLSANLASCFSAYPIIVPSLRERGHAVLRWADKILLQESNAIKKSVKGFSPDAQQAMAINGSGGPRPIADHRRRTIDTGPCCPMGDSSSTVCECSE